MEFDNLSDLFKTIEKDIKAITRNEVSEIIKDTMVAEIQNTVYAPYVPTYYYRRYTNGGLSDKHNMKTRLIRDGIEVVNHTPLHTAYGRNPVSKTLAEIIVSGEGYMFHNGGEYENKRDFISATWQDLSSGIAIDTVKQALKKRGYHAE